MARVVPELRQHRTIVDGIPMRIIDSKYTITKDCTDFKLTSGGVLFRDNSIIKFKNKTPYFMHIVINYTLPNNNVRHSRVILVNPHAKVYTYNSVYWIRARLHINAMIPL